MVSLQNTTKHNVMQQPNWSIKTSSQLFVNNLVVNSTELVSNRKHQFNTPPPPLLLFPHPNNKLILSYKVCQSFTIGFKIENES